MEPHATVLQRTVDALAERFDLDPSDVLACIEGVLDEPAPQTPIHSAAMSHHLPRWVELDCSREW